ncbi:unnamed protein product [Arabis nemorensis]|uniref:non-specific serine/threonine protein kinase n=1 Tax=Arabis nemorensis TaxID=586526 RepID=A0A565AX90_9BRAS|nr:unnamed protein product [Arabis nemorensis]
MKWIHPRAGHNFKDCKRTNLLVSAFSRVTEACTAFITRELYSNGLKRPVPDSIFRSQNLNDLRTSDITARFGHVPQIASKSLRLLYLTGNMLSGDIESGVFLTASTNIDLSYNNFTWSSGCKERKCECEHIQELKFKKQPPNSASSGSNNCQNCSKSLHINCSGEDVTIKSSRGYIIYQGDNYGQTVLQQIILVTTGDSAILPDFMDDATTEDAYSVSSESLVLAKYPELYQRARRSPLSMSYNAFCIENGSYNVKLHFAEIQFSDKEPYSILAKRLFNIYVQGKLIWEDFSIREEANGTHKEVIREVNRTVRDNSLEIRCIGQEKARRSFHVERTIDLLSLQSQFVLGKLSDGTLIAERILAFLHEESTVKIIHRDIEGTNVLLDKDLNAKISDFGLARLHEDEKSLISTRITGTIGYMAPEYAMRGYLTEADVYSFGIVTKEIVSGKSNAFLLHKKGDFADNPKLEGKLDLAEAERMVKVGLLCTNKSPTLSPSMSEVVKMLEGESEIEQSISGPNVYGDDLQFEPTSETGDLIVIFMSVSPSSPSAYDLYPLGAESIVLRSSLYDFIFFCL